MISPNIKELIKYLKLYKSNLLVVLLSLTMVSMSLLSIGHVFRLLIDNGLKQNQIDQINHAIFAISILIAIFAISSFFRSYSINIVTEKITSKLKLDTYDHLLKIDIAKFEGLKIGDIILRLGSDIENIGKLITNFLSFFIRNLVMLIGGITLMVFQSPKMSLLVILGVPALLFPLLKLSRHLRNLSKSVLANQGNLAAIIEENFNAIRTLHAYNMQPYISRKFANDTDLYLKHSSKRLKIRALFFALAISIIAVSITMVIWVGSIDIVNGTMSSGQMISFIYYAIIVGMSSGGIAELFSEIQSPLASLDRVFELKHLNHKNYTSNSKDPIIQNYDIEFNNVNFSYPSRPTITILKNLSFVITEGKFTAIVGKSGSGKSTILQVLMKFYNHQSGSIKIGSHDTHYTDPSIIRSKIAYVEQDPTIFSGTIRSNILFSRPEAKQEEIEQIASLCGITDFADSLPQGLDTEIGEKGIRISGGQKQRIAIARALLYMPEILLLDEATSSMDSDSEKTLLQKIEHFLQGKTIISIAHRISSIEHADDILVIDSGQLVNRGPHNQLICESSIYKLLYQEQVKIAKGQ